MGRWALAVVIALTMSFSMDYQGRVLRIYIDQESEETRARKFACTLTHGGQFDTYELYQYRRNAEGTFAPVRLDGGRIVALCKEQS